MAIAQDFFIDYTNKLIVHATTELAYDAQTANFTVGDIVTGGTSGATARIVADTDSGTTGTLHLAYVYGTFADNETLTDQHTGSATSNIPSGVTTKSTVYTTRALYSFIQDTFDELGQMDDTVPMSAQTPTEFTLINGWFIDDTSVKFLKGGALQTSGYDGVIQIITFGSTYTNARNSDIGKTVQDDSVDTGALLHFNNTTKKWWVRWGTTIASGSTMTITSGTGAGTTNTTGDYAGEDLYANVYTLGSIATNPNPQTYIFQNSSSITPWWGRGDADAAIDVLVKVKESGTEIDGANITVYIRQFGDLYDHFTIDLSNGGRNAVPLSSATDLNNNTTGEATLAYVSQTGNFTANTIVTGATSGSTAEIIADSDSGTSGTLTLGNIKGTFQNGEVITDTSTGSATVSGTVTNIVAGYNNVDIWFVNGTDRKSVV